MHEREVLISRIERSLADVGRARQAINEITGDRFRNRIQVRFDTEFTKHLENGLALLETVRDGKDLRACWRSFIAIDSDLRSLLDECLSLMQGTMDRLAGLDDGICEIADA